MDKEVAENGGGSPGTPRDPDRDQSFVGKFKSQVSEIISNTPLSKWFRRQTDSGTIRGREDDPNDEELYELQPPLKRAKLPGGSLDFGTTKKSYDSFPEPIAGPSGVKSLKLTKGQYGSAASVANGKDSDSEESTSGYSSVARIGSKEQVCGSQQSSKQASPLETSPNKARSNYKNATTLTRSLFAERSVSPHVNSSMSSRRPSFNASTFGSPNFVDRTLSTQKIINSPFYSGRTIYGGASAYGKALGRSSKDLKANLRKTVEIKPVNRTEGSGNVQLGKTARRILDTLEQYSTPVQDAKKIPVSSKKHKSDGLLSKYTGTNPYMVRTASNKELQVPSVTDLLKMKQNQQKTRLQDSTEAVRQIATLSKSTLNEETYKITTTEKEQEKHTTKMKTKITSVRQKVVIEETHSEPKLKPVALPITTLPKFDIKLPEPAKIVSPPTKSKEIPVSKPQTPAKRPLIVDPPFKAAESVTIVEEFKFSEPKVLGENLKAVAGINDFKFSEPLCKKTRSETRLNFKMPENNAILTKPKNNGEAIAKTAPPLKTGSVMDVLGKKDSLAEKFKPPENSWECSVCLIRNKAENVKCAACETPKKIVNKPLVGFGDKFKPPASTWECAACMIRNKEESSKCVACESPKPAPKVGAGLNTGFGGKFVPSSDTWECDTCLVRNGKEKTKCVACETPKKGGSASLIVLPSAEKAMMSGSTGFGAKFAPPSDTWECDTCLVRNKQTSTKCVACETPKKGSSAPQASLSSLAAFQKKENEWDCGVCMVKNKASDQKCQCCETPKPGTTASGSVLKLDKQSPADKPKTSSFTFGVPVTQQTSLNTNAGSIFGSAAKAATPAATPSFSFGVPSPKPEEKPKTADPKPVEPPKVNPLLKPEEKLPEKAVPAAAGFTFSAKTEQVPPAANGDIKKPSFGFAPAKTESKPAAPANLFSFAAKPATEATKPAAEPPKATFKFGASASSSNVPQMPSFGAKPEKVVPTAIEAPAPKLPASNAETTPTKFGSSAPIISTAGTSNVQSTFGSSSNVPAFGSSVTASPAFGGSVTASPAFGGSVTASPAFGGSSNVPASNAPAFGGNAAEVKPFGFGSSAPGQQSGSDPPPAKSAMFSFGQTATTTPSGGFGFGQTQPGFGFGKTEPAKTEAAAMFSFGKAASFGGSSKENTNVFDAAPAPATVPSVNGGFNFGSAASNATQQKAGFNFGGAAATGSSTPQTAFNFGSASAAPSTGGFSFAAPTQPPVFDVNVKPTFNFSAGNDMPTFSAPPPPPSEGPGPAQRKIRRAVRRTQR